MFTAISSAFACARASTEARLLIAKSAFLAATAAASADASEAASTFAASCSANELMLSMILAT